MRWWLLPAWVLFSCGDVVVEPGATARIDVVLRTPVDPDPVPAIGPPVFGSYAITVTSHSPVQRHALTIQATAGETTLDLDTQLLETEAAELEVAVLDAVGGDMISRAHSAPFALRDGVTTSVNAFLGRTDTWSLLDAAAGWERAGGAATALASGQVLIAGGRAAGSHRSAVLYDHDSGVLHDLVDAPEARFATLVAFGDHALMAGGLDTHESVSAASWVFDLANETFAPGPAVHSHYAGVGVWFAEAAKLLLAGGVTEGGAANSTLTVLDVSGPSPVVESTLALTTARAWATATVLTNLARPAALVVGGLDGVGGTALASAELIEIDGGVINVIATGDLATARSGHCAAAFERSNGQALIWGGDDGTTPLVDGAPEIFDPTYPPTGGFRPLPLPIDPALHGPRVAPAAASLADGSVLVAGGLGLDPAAAGSLLVTSAQQVVAISGPRAWLPRAGGQAVTLFDGSVLLLGGSPNEVPGTGTLDLTPVASAEVFVSRCGTSPCR